MTLRVPKRYAPREQFSPSGLSVLERCGWQWLLRYLRGIKEDDLASWDEAQHIPRPAKPETDAPAIAHAKHREAVKEYNRLTRRALGHALHHAMQVYYDWHPPLVDVWQEEAWAEVCALATAGIRYLPSAKDCSWLGTEVEVSLDIAGVRVFGFVDLIVHLKRARRRTKIVDYKSTGNLDWSPTPEEMLEDVAACFYALAVMVAEDSEEVDCLWVYFLTDPEKKADAWAVEFTISREQAIATLSSHERRAELALEVLRLWEDGDTERARSLPVVQPNAEACGDFGGCVYHPEKTDERLCRPPRLTTGQQLQLETGKKSLLEKRKEYRRTAQQARPRPPAPSSAPRVRKKAKTRTMARSLADRIAASGDEEKDGGGSAERGESRAGGGGEREPTTRARSSGGSSSSSARGGKRKKGPTLILVVREDGKDDVELALPEGTPLYERNLKAADAILGE